MIDILNQGTVGKEYEFINPNIDVVYLMKLLNIVEKNIPISLNRYVFMILNLQI